ncbi:hypothetical protein C8J56DRAFT_280865 [Mycena floridula]|nr:hypothetical protein C8J56DRAFT_280865 [Mycena floridula]
MYQLDVICSFLFALNLCFQGRTQARHDTLGCGRPFCRRSALLAVSKMSFFKNLSPNLLSAHLFYGCLSRLTSGTSSALTPSFYEFQLSRAPNDQTVQAWTIPLIDAALATALLFPGRPRRWGSVLVLGFLSLGVVMRVSEGKDWAPDGLLAAWGLVNLFVVNLK